MSQFVTMEFPTEKIKLTRLMCNEARLAEIRACSPDAPTPEKIRTVYGEVCFPPAPEDRPYLFASIVVSADGKISFTDDRHGEKIAGNNFRDPDGAMADFWVLNMLRFYADGIIIGARTLHTNEEMWANCFDEELASLRTTQMGMKAYCPAHIVVSFDGTDIPFDHMIFDIDAQLILATSPAGLDYIRANCPREFLPLGPFATPAEVDPAAVRAAVEANPGKLIVVATGQEAQTDGPAMLKILKALEMNRVMVESPSYMTYLMSIQAMDEMFMNYSSVFAAGQVGFGAFLQFAAEDHPHSDFLSIALHGANFIFTRQEMIYGLKRS